ncbi:MAG TPA: hypothetical protein VFO10_23725 [Oligoflexus sp.]|uniref:hypothetical protein n=1 Tax=Oligoflexus sp. TaxID=1971216 RepID=UPI002D80D443|nr:hypothetical protein [Oligoflexus sp.]HET9240293.1 hypothetical protein [Oligoflexus sp.]
MFEDNLVGCFSWEMRDSSLAMVKGVGNAADKSCVLEGSSASFQQVDDLTTKANYPDGSSSTLTCFPVTRTIGDRNGSCPKISLEEVFLADEYFEEKLIGGCYRQTSDTCMDYFGSLGRESLPEDCTGKSASCFDLEYDVMRKGCPRETELGFGIEWFHDDTTVCNDME